MSAVSRLFSGLSGFAWRFGIDGEGVDPPRYQIVERIINEPMARHPRKPAETRADHADAVVRTLARARMAGVQVAVVTHRELGRIERGSQRGLDVGGDRAIAHDGRVDDFDSAASGSTWRLR